MTEGKREEKVRKRQGREVFENAVKRENKLRN